MNRAKEFSDGGASRGRKIVAALKRWNVAKASGTYIERRMKLEERRSGLMRRVNGLQKIHNANPTDQNKRKLDQATRELKLISEHMKASYETR